MELHWRWDWWTIIACGLIVAQLYPRFGGASTSAAWRAIVLARHGGAWCGGTGLDWRAEETKKQIPIGGVSARLFHNS